MQGCFPFRVPREPTGGGLGQRHLCVEPGQVAFDDRQSEAKAGRGDVAQLELDRAAASTDLLLQSPVLARLVKRASRQLIAEHRKVGCDDGVVFEV